MAERYKLTEKLIKAAELKSAKYHLFDSDLLGFSAVIHPSGLRAFCLHYWVQGRQRKLTIGRWPEWSVVAARERAKVLRREIDAGDDPMARREVQRAAPRIPDLIDLYIEQHLPRLSPRNASDQVSMLRNLVEPEWKTRLVADIMSDDVARLLTKIAEGRARPAKEKEKEKEKAKSRGKRKLQGQKPTPIRANRVGEVLRKMFNLSVRPWKMRDDNPAEGFLRRAETERERFLSLEEVYRLANALAAAEDQRGAALVRMCMLTPASARFGWRGSSSSISTSASGRSRRRPPSSGGSTGSRSPRTSRRSSGCAEQRGQRLAPGSFPGTSKVSRCRTSGGSGKLSRYLRNCRMFACTICGTRSLRCWPAAGPRWR